MGASLCPVPRFGGVQLLKIAIKYSKHLILKGYIKVGTPSALVE